MENPPEPPNELVEVMKQLIEHGTPNMDPVHRAGIDQIRMFANSFSLQSTYEFLITEALYKDGQDENARMVGMKRVLDIKGMSESQKETVIICLTQTLATILCDLWGGWQEAIDALNDPSKPLLPGGKVDAEVAALYQLDREMNGQQAMADIPPEPLIGP